ncbi:hypothetical protein ADIWIN_1460 [Winogradskyella psychrotolerans RS-3]|uniref:Uncharacterized protein n=1 Tax=Winogradskyella psychrotolerans RS-3 TaxID=641526 RepID=S7VT51_9FLAO|nr:hypothetical protein ADIWIN_1460 [Winogradskyella psychrotolerans RS-3]
MLKELVNNEMNLPDLIRAFTEAAMELFPDYYGIKNATAALIGIPNNLDWDGMWDFLADYFRSNHGKEINEYSAKSIKVFSSIRHERFEDGVLTSESEVDRVINITFDNENNILVSIAPSLSPKKAAFKSGSEYKKSYVGFDPDYLFTVSFDDFNEIDSFMLEMPNRKLKIVYYD